MKIEEIDIDKIKPNDWNPNEMTDSTFQHLKQEYERIGFLQPILVRPIEEGYEIVDGEHRYQAAEEMNIEELTCIIKEMDKDTAQITTLNMNNIKGTDNPLETAELIKTLEEDKETEELSELLNLPETEIKQYDLLLDMPDEEEIEELEEDQEPEPYELTLTYYDEDKTKIIKKTLDQAEGEDPEEKFYNISKYFINGGERNE